MDLTEDVDSYANSGNYHYDLGLVPSVQLSSLGNVMLTIEQVADHVLAMSPYGSLSNRELQKILYFAQGFHLASKGEPLFSETLYAWDFGPVNLTIWHKFKTWGYNGISAPAKDKLVPLDKDLAAFLSAIVIAFASQGQSKLIEMSHADAPWASTYIPQANKILDQNEIGKYFGAFNSIDEYLTFAQQKLAFHELVVQRKTYLGGLPQLGNDWISGKSEAPSVQVCETSKQFIAGLERFIFASSAKPEIPKMILGPIPSGGVGLEFRNSRVGLYVHMHNSGMVEVDVERDGHYESAEISFPEFEEDFAVYYKELV
jgi:uncharacterized phage-associated protein